MKKMIAAATMAFVQTLSLTAQAGDSAHGGDPDGLAFKAAAAQAIDELTRLNITWVSSKTLH